MSNCVRPRQRRMLSHELFGSASNIRGRTATTCPYISSVLMLISCPLAKIQSGVFQMANEANQGQQSGGQQQKENPSGQQQPGQNKPKPSSEQESQGNEQQRRAPGQEQGNDPTQRRTPGEGQKEGENERKRA